jgi:antitoxin PrlF
MNFSSNSYMAAILRIQAESKLTDRYQTTVPDPVRRALGLGKGDRLLFVIEGGDVIVRRAETAQEGDDPALRPFLDLLAGDIAAHPERLREINPALVRRARELASGVEFDIDQPLAPEDE